MEVEKSILTRRSARSFNRRPVNEDDIQAVLKAAVWAPSGLNNQPWRFKVIRNDIEKDGLAGFTKYAYIIKEAPVSICVFLDKTAVYNREKDIMAIGACIQNMLLQAHAMGLGSCWLGEILNRKEEVREFLKIQPEYELMAVVSFGYPKGKPPKGSRKKMESFMFEG
ncbi:MAG: nitroreductase family protein [Candidatus Omnitrophota bacterium]